MGTGSMLNSRSNYNFEIRTSQAIYMQAIAASLRMMVLHLLSSILSSTQLSSPL